jgi:hypothetical protein
MGEAPLSPVAIPVQSCVPRSIVPSPCWSCGDVVLCETSGGRQTLTRVRTHLVLLQRWTERFLLAALVDDTDPLAILSTHQERAGGRLAERYHLGETGPLSQGVQARSKALRIRRKERPRGFKKEAQGVQVSSLNPLYVAPCVPHNLGCNAAGCRGHR